MDKAIELRQSAGSQVFYNKAQKATFSTAKGSPGRLLGWKIQNLDAAAAYLQFFDSASPTVGTDKPKMSIPFPSSGFDDYEYSLPLEFDTAITVAATTTVEGNTSGSTGLLINLFYV